LSIKIEIFVFLRKNIGFDWVRFAYFAFSGTLYFPACIFQRIFLTWTKLFGTESGFNFPLFRFQRTIWLCFAFFIDKFVRKLS